MVGDSKSLNPNGTGIGLTVSKKYVEAMGGTIKLESVKDEGTSVTFTIEIDTESTMALDREGIISSSW